MAENEQDPKDAEPTTPPSIKENPSATGVVASTDEEPAAPDRE